MVDTQHFCLRWNNYQSSITSAFENLRDDEDFVDVTLACDGRSLKAHRVVLSACSPYFRELLKSTPCKHPVIVLQDVAFTDLHALVEFIYHGEVNVHQRSLSSFLKTAEILRVSGLTQQQAEDTHNLTQVQGPPNQNMRPPISQHDIYTNRIGEEGLFAHQDASPPPHMNSLPNAHSGRVNQLLRQAAAAAAMRRERNSSSLSDDLGMKRHRGEQGNNNNLDSLSHPPQVTAADFSTNLAKHNNNLSPSIKDSERLDASKLSIGHNNNNINTNNNVLNSNNKDHSSNATIGNGGGSVGSVTDKESSTPSPSANDDVKSEPMELICGNNMDGDQSNDSINDQVINRSGSASDAKACASSPNAEEMDSGIHSHTAPPFLMSPESKLFPSPGSFNFSMAALTDPASLGFNPHSLQNPGDLGAQGSSLLGSGSSSSALANRLSLPLPLTACHRCDVCGKLLSTKLTLKRHKEQQHLQPLNNAVCNLCHKVFRTLNSLNNHKSIYHRRQKHHQFGGNGGGGLHHGHQGPATHLGMHSPISPTQSNNPHKLEFM
ncbi:broad-complex core protein isoform X2 [Culicoides brevitarsis]|uniref:broad-complex core protein isoform X2 n=1 Tax=Culicoides brevitarsis TaxID=469753 RepID=UPI00307C8258